MRYSFLKTIVFLFILVMAGVSIDRYFFDRKMNNFGPILVKNPASSIFERLENTRFFLRDLINIRNLTLENENLKKENLILASQLAGYENTKKENRFLKDALKISPRFGSEVIYANIFSSQLGPGGYDVLLNKGAENGINDNDIVITESGVLIGKIKKTYDGFAHLLMVGDINFSITAKILNSDTAGIARGVSNKELYFDLIVQSDPIKEGDMVVSSGMDFYPPSLLIGIVSHVEISETDLFKKVKIRPVAGDIKIGRVLVVRKK